ncbi:MAG TPA: EutN/CcmL family microcompartment protein [Thermoanaerobaculia bacterium]|nr:EutN/CcmL family microcompartment protein [Thermoanaerobaculia bacterium]
MQLARVVGTVVATRKEPSLQGLKLLVVKPLDEKGQETGNALVAADAVGAGPDEIVLIAAGSSARQTEATDKRPVDAVVMAIVDSWSVGDDVKFKK